MGEAPVLVHGTRKLSQSGVCLTYLADRTGKFAPQGEDERLEALRWAYFRQSEGQRLPRALPVLRNLPNPGPTRPCSLPPRDASTATCDRREATRDGSFMLGERPTIADISMVAYLYYPAEDSDSISPARIRRSPSGSIAIRRCRAGSTPMADAGLSDDRDGYYRCRSAGGSLRRPTRPPRIHDGAPPTPRLRKKADASGRLDLLQAFGRLRVPAAATAVERHNRPKT